MGSRRGAVDAALTAVDLIVSGAHDVAYALCRPPGHHATAAGYGGSCYLNNAGVAAEALRRSGHPRVAVVDIDAHHGNGTQMIFYDRADVFYGSVHVDPAARWFPHYVGHADEAGRGDGRGANRNIPMAEGAGDGPWLDGVAALVESVRSSIEHQHSSYRSESMPLSTTPRARYRSPNRAIARPVFSWRPSVFRPLRFRRAGTTYPHSGRLVVATIAGLESRG